MIDVGQTNMMIDTMTTTEDMIDTTVDKTIMEENMIPIKGVIITTTIGEMTMNTTGTRMNDDDIVTEAMKSDMQRTEIQDRTHNIPATIEHLVMTKGHRVLKTML